ncbi:hypothetical protein P5673_014031 [Acropora cervicornis]|uniref:Uncharacterized protein n=1 Tax=Acropora cervicornis TaxID=6130 RepID=A0AAD9QKN7_ACRCE|nr:hypothetical protein P5673_014031 [Acropora cervicornis]
MHAQIENWKLKKLNDLRPSVVPQVGIVQNYLTLADIMFVCRPWLKVIEMNDIFLGDFNKEKITLKAQGYKGARDFQLSNYDWKARDLTKIQKTNNFAYYPKKMLPTRYQRPLLLFLRTHSIVSFITNFNPQCRWGKTLNGVFGIKGWNIDAENGDRTNFSNAIRLIQFNTPL